MSLRYWAHIDLTIAAEQHLFALFPHARYLQAHRASFPTSWLSITEPIARVAWSDDP